MEIFKDDEKENIAYLSVINVNYRRSLTDKVINQIKNKLKGIL